MSGRRNPPASTASKTSQASVQPSPSTSAAEKKASYKSFQKFLDNVRYVLSTIITISAITLVIYSIGKGYAALPGYPPLLYLTFAAVLVLLAYLEGLQVAILALESSDSSLFGAGYERALKTHTLATGQGGLNVQRFLIGRQFFVVFVVFLCAQLTTFKDLPRHGVPSFLFYAIIDTGLPGALIVLAFGQLMPQLLGATHPVTLLNLPGTWSVVQLTLCFESLGVTHFSWIATNGVKKIFKLGPREDIFSSSRTNNNNNNSSPTNSNYAGLLAHDNLVAEDEELLRDKLGCEKTVSLRGLDVDKLYSGAQRGLEPADDGNDVSEQWLSNIPSTAFRGWGFDATKYPKNKHFPEPNEIAKHLVDNKQSVPRYLLPPTHEEHIPPHVVAYDLIRRQKLLSERLAESRQREMEVERRLFNAEQRLTNLSNAAWVEMGDEAIVGSNNGSKENASNNGSQALDIAGGGKAPKGKATKLAMNLGSPSMEPLMNVDGGGDRDDLPDLRV